MDHIPFILLEHIFDLRVLIVEYTTHKCRAKEMRPSRTYQNSSRDTKLNKRRPNFRHIFTIQTMLNINSINYAFINNAFAKVNM